MLPIRQRSVSSPVIIFSKTKRCAASVVNTKQMNKCPLGYLFIRSSMVVCTVIPVLAVPVPHIPAAKVPGALVSLELLIPRLACQW